MEKILCNICKNEIKDPFVLLKMKENTRIENEHKDCQYSSDEDCSFYYEEDWGVFTVKKYCKKHDLFIDEVEAGNDLITVDMYNMIKNLKN